MPVCFRTSIPLRFISVADSLPIADTTLRPAHASMAVRIVLPAASAPSGLRASLFPHLDSASLHLGRGQPAYSRHHTAPGSCKHGRPHCAACCTQSLSSRKKAPSLKGTRLEISRYHPVSHAGARTLGMCNVQSTALPTLYFSEAQLTWEIRSPSELKRTFSR